MKLVSLLTTAGGRVPTPPLGVHVPHVRELVTQEQVIRSHTRRVIAAMQDAYTFGYRAVVQFPRNTMSEQGRCWGWSATDSPVPVPITTAGPLPAPIALLNLQPEAISKRLGRSWWRDSPNLIRDRTGAATELPVSRSSARKDNPARLAGASELMRRFIGAPARTATEATLAARVGEWFVAVFTGRLMGHRAALPFGVNAPAGATVRGNFMPSIVPSFRV